MKFSVNSNDDIIVYFRKKNCINNLNSCYLSVLNELLYSFLYICVLSFE